MKYFKTYNQLINETVVTDRILYHGSPYVFKDFKDTTTFFSKTEEFAEQYAETKSMDAGLDNEPNLYKVKVNCDILDVNNPDDFDKLKNALPDKVEYHYNNFGFSREVDKDEILFNMKGFYINEPYEPIKDCKIGDEIPEPSYPSEKHIVYKIDKNYVYAYSKKEMSYLLNNIFSFSSNFNIKREVRELYKPIYDYVKEYIKTTTNKNYVSDHDIVYYSYIFFGNKKYAEAYDINIPEENIKEFNVLYDELKKNLQNYIVGRNYMTKFNRKPETIKLENTWRYFENETVHTAIVSLGYGGYSALERKIPTYALFHPSKDTKILKYEFPSGREFNSWKDWENYISYQKYISDNLPNSYNKLWELYKLYKKGTTKEDCLKILSK